MQATRWSRRSFAAAGLSSLWPSTTHAQGDDEALVRALREGGVVFAMRHARAPGTFDPPGFKLGECSTQRNLDDEGRAQARRIGDWFASRKLQPQRVLSSPWCRCIDTATLAFGRASAWLPLSSPGGRSGGVGEQRLQPLRAALRDAAARPQSFDVWVTHMFVLSALVGSNTDSGEGLLLRAGRGVDAVEVIGRLAVT